MFFPKNRGCDCGIFLPSPPSLPPNILLFAAPFDLCFRRDVFGLTFLEPGETIMVCWPRHTVSIYYVTSLQVAVFLLVHSHFSDSRSWDPPHWLMDLALPSLLPFAKVCQLDIPCLSSVMNVYYSGLCVLALIVRNNPDVSKSHWANTPKRCYSPNGSNCHLENGGRYF